MDDALPVVSRREWGVALGLFAVVAVALFLLSWPAGVLDLTGDQATILTARLKQRDPSLFARDFVAADPRFMSEYPPLFGRLMEATRGLAGDWVLAFRLWLIPMGLAYLVAMYVFLRPIVRSGGAAILTAILSLPAVPTLGATYWGLGPVGFVQTRSLALPLAPLCVWLTLRWERSWKLPVVFALLGVMANVHPVSTILLAGALGPTLLARRGLSRRALARLAACAAAFVLGALPFALRFAHGTAAPIAAADVAEANRIIQERYAYQFLSTVPLSLGALGGWALVVAAAGLGWRAARKRLDDRDRFLGLFGLAVVVTSLGGAGLVEWIARASGRPFIEMHVFRGFRHVFLVYYAYVGLLVAEALAWIRRGSNVVRIPGWVVVGGVVVAAAVPARRTLRVDEFLQALRWGRPPRPPLLALCDEVRRSTPRDSLFHLCDFRVPELGTFFRMLAERSVTVTWRGAGHLWYGDRAKLPEWEARMKRNIADWRSRRTASVVAAARGYGADYAVVPWGWEPVDLPVHYAAPGAYTVYALGP